MCVFEKIPNTYMHLWYNYFSNENINQNLCINNKMLRLSNFQHKVTGKILVSAKSEDNIVSKTHFHFRLY